MTELARHKFYKDTEYDGMDYEEAIAAGMRGDRYAFVREARECVGTPYAHMGRVKNVGLDCIGTALWCCNKLNVLPSNYIDEPYGRIPNGIMVRQLRKCCNIIWEKETAGSTPFQTLLTNGDLASFSWRREPQHIAVMAIGEQGWNMIHAYDGSGTVIETIMDEPWVHRCQGIYRLPDLK